MLSAALAAGLFPKLLSIDPLTGQLRTYSNNQPASIHPSSVNFRAKVLEFGTSHLAFFTIMHSCVFHLRRARWLNGFTC